MKLMTLEELQNKRRALQKETDICKNNMDVIINESRRVEQVAHNAKVTLAELDAEFECQTGLTGQDLAFLFVATALQCVRIYLVNNATKIEPAGGKNEFERNLHKAQNKIFDNFKKQKSGLNDIKSEARPYYAPFISSYHVIYEQGIVKKNNIYKSPKIAMPCSTGIMLGEALKRIDGDLSSVIAAIIKQIIHIGTDLYTPCGIQLPGANLVLSTKNVEMLTKYISTGDVIKVGASAGIAAFINTIISIMHMLMYDEDTYASRNVYSVKTKKLFCIQI